MGRIRISLFRRMEIKEYHGLGGVYDLFPLFLLYQMIPYQLLSVCRVYTGVGCFVSFSTLRLGNTQARAAQSLLFLLVCAPGKVAVS
jgi:hypothetical protein